MKKKLLAGAAFLFVIMYFSSCYVEVREGHRYHHPWWHHHDHDHDRR